VEYLSPELITSLIAESDARAASKVKSRNRNKNMFCIDGTIYNGKPSSEIAGRFESRVGSKRRSRKGRTVTLPNGFAHYGSYSSPSASYYRVTQ
jgi:hypothetical protein